jgi:hypothetical protein
MSQRGGGKEIELSTIRHVDHTHLRRESPASYKCTCTCTCTRTGTHVHVLELHTAIYVHVQRPMGIGHKPQGRVHTAAGKPCCTCVSFTFDLWLSYTLRLNKQAVSDSRSQLHCFCMCVECEGIHPLTHFLSNNNSTVLSTLFLLSLTRLSTTYPHRVLLIFTVSVCEWVWECVCMCVYMYECAWVWSCEWVCCTWIRTCICPLRFQGLKWHYMAYSNSTLAIGKRSLS